MAFIVVGVLLTAGFFVVDRVVSNRPEAKLIGRVPESLRGSCTQAPAPAEIGSSATLICKDVTGQEIRISLFDTRSGMDQVYEETIRGAGVARDSGDCAIASGAEHRYPGVGALVGRALCYQQGDSTILVWTDDAQRTVARASRADGNDLELYRSWAALVGAPSFPTPEERALLGVVEQSSCHRVPAGALNRFAGLAAAVECDPQISGVSKVTYYRFTDLDGLGRSYNSHVTSAKAPKAFCEGDSTPGFLGEGIQDLGSVVIGRVLCHPRPGGEYAIEWTVEPLLILAEAVGTDPKALGDWRRTHFDLRIASTVEAVNAQARPRFPAPEEQALLLRIPIATRTYCMRPSAEQIDLNVTRGKVVAAIVCVHTRGAGIVFYYQFPDHASMDANYQRYVFPGPACTNFPLNFTGEAEYSREGAVTGRLLCKTNDNGSRYLSWIHDQFNIQVFAFQGYEPATLIGWWRDEAGPI